ncbi:MAG: PD-(D/E)XK nuclease family protein [Candidatus Edwardsbacteria bacterium]|nr:PD-(D/E)XK nuclease family protein [Candidatus Edwardsbacteria bacterium]MBU1576910.1 PD-(D/E)XK nuclease family protein [Candidatus Edwardsbacteria bacterium]MBU2463093.1 PD-(D/E)XK nuclease family protein [Candidatus Edwardsbacteria bacterium]MBU2594271.1 PD-(D/E)XK nuclease family protein [Candidatus Edwardsbacteria bacterium]
MKSMDSRLIEQKKSLILIEKELALCALETELEKLKKHPEPEFNLFDAFYVHEEEQVSTILAYLFNWNNALSAGDKFLYVFLEKFLDTSNSAIIQKNKWYVELEVHVTDEKGEKARRPDIVLECDEMVVFIENKINKSAIKENQIKETIGFIDGAKNRWLNKKKTYLVLAPDKNNEIIKNECEKARREHKDINVTIVGWDEVINICRQFITKIEKNTRLYFTMIDFSIYIKRIMSDGR